ncbi:Hypothetical_protein [Hexamita inflata]|uniref:Hypothetical_protein n=1 Tax=Hexamita inflata TaxID=28002 RepID=A0AA86VFC0_9EUKA|nr:Hypothetical protein HINF_LOCUS52758 [Hexamita inflata]
MQRLQKQRQQKTRNEYNILKVQFGTKKYQADKIEAQLMSSSKIQQLISTQEEQIQQKDNIISKYNIELMQLHDTVYNLLQNEKDYQITQFKAEAQNTRIYYLNNYNLSSTAQISQTLNVQKDIEPFTEDEKIMGLILYIKDGSSSYEQLRLTNNRLPSTSTIRRFKIEYQQQNNYNYQKETQKDL